MSETLQDLIEQHDIKATPIYTHTKDDGRLNNDVYDVLLTIDTGVSLYGGINNTRTLLVRGWGQSHNNSRRQNGDRLIPPTVAEVLHGALSDAASIDATSDWEDWADDFYGSDRTFANGLGAYGTWRAIKAQRDDLARFLGDAYGQFKDAATEYEG